MNDDKEHVTKLLRDCIIAEDVLRKNPWSWKACHPKPDSPEGIEYNRLHTILYDADAKLWMATDFEYDKDGFRDIVWNWRYWKVMARKCCWFQRFGTTYRAGRTMKKLHKAEEEFARVCGLLDIYRSPCSYIEEQFPNLKSNA